MPRVKRTWLKRTMNLEPDVVAALERIYAGSTDLSDLVRRLLRIHLAKLESAKKTIEDEA